MALDLLPRLLVHHVLGDFVVDPWTTGRFDLTRYGVTGYRTDLNPATGWPVFIIEHRLGAITVDPLAGGAAPDLTPYGIASYEVIWGPPPADLPDLPTALAGAGTGLLGLGIVAAAVWWGRRR